MGSQQFLGECFFVLFFCLKALHTCSRPFVILLMCREFTENCLYLVATILNLRPMWFSPSHVIGVTACPANRHLKSTIKKIKSPQTFCTPCEFLKKCVCHVWWSYRLIIQDSCIYIYGKSERYVRPHNSDLTKTWQYVSIPHKQRYMYFEPVRKLGNRTWGSSPHDGTQYCTALVDGCYPSPIPNILPSLYALVVNWNGESCDGTCWYCMCAWGFCRGQ